MKCIGVVSLQWDGVPVGAAVAFPPAPWEKAGAKGYTGTAGGGQQGLNP